MSARKCSGEIIYLSIVNMNKIRSAKFFDSLSSLISPNWLDFVRAIC